MREAAGEVWGCRGERIHVEIFNGGESMTPGVVGTVRRNPHVPEGDAADGSTGFVCAEWCCGAFGCGVGGIRAFWNWRRRAMCRCGGHAGPGVCHNCESGLISGDVVLRARRPLEMPAAGEYFDLAARGRWGMWWWICELRSGRPSRIYPSQRRLERVRVVDRKRSNFNSPFSINYF